MGEGDGIEQKHVFRLINQQLPFPVRLSQPFRYKNGDAWNIKQGTDWQIYAIAHSARALTRGGLIKQNRSRSMCVCMRDWNATSGCGAGELGPRDEKPR